MEILKPFVLGKSDMIDVLLTMPTKDILPLIINNGLFNFITPIGNATPTQLRNICLFMLQGIQEFPDIAVPFMMNGGKLVRILQRTNDLTIVWVFAELARPEENMKRLILYFEEQKLCIVDACLAAVAEADW